MKKSKGFTLGEAVVAVIILGILASIIIPQFTALPETKNESLEQIKARVQEERGRARAKKAREERVHIKAKVKANVKPKHEIILEKYFGNMASEIPEIRWMEFDGNSIYIGFNPIPSDVRTILGFWAFGGWKRINFGCHIYAYDASRYSPTTDGNFFAGATCRYGKTKHY